MSSLYKQSHLFRWLFLIKSLFRSEKSLLKLLRFSIGEQYENYEFHLKYKESIITDNITYEAYYYDKSDFKKLFGLNISRGIILCYNADILTSVYYRFNENHFQYLINEINSYLPLNKKMERVPFEKHLAVCEIDEKLSISLRVKKNGDTGLCLTSKNKNQHILQ